MSTNRFGVRTLAVFAVAGIAVLGTPSIASAHVSAQPSEFTQGGRATFAFRVPNERDAAGTIKLEITLPQDTPLTSVRTKPLPGWKAEVVKGKLDKPVTLAGKEVTEAFKTITWTAEPGVKIAPNEYQEFFVALGTLPEGKDKLELPAKQTYENGEVVDWAQSTGTDGKEPEHPAPALKLAAKKAGDDGHGGHGTAPAANTAADTHEAAVGGSDKTARYLGGAGLAVGALGLGLGVGAVLRSRRKA